MHVDRALNLVATFATALNDVVRRSAETTVGMSGGAPAALVAIAAEPAMNIDTLRRALGLSHPGTVRLVDRLEAKGWVRRVLGTGRAVKLHATDAGEHVAQQLLVERENSVKKFLSALSASDRDALAELVAPTLEHEASNETELRRLCRLCDRDSCQPCPPWENLKTNNQNSVDERSTTPQ